MPADERPPRAPWLIVAAGFHFRGGMDKANAELASYLLSTGVAVHLVAHDVDALFLEHPRATVHVVARPLGSFALGEFGLDRRGRAVARELRRAHPATRVVVNGGNCRFDDINWVHYVHHAWREVDPAAPAWFKVKHRLFSVRWRRLERRALRASRLVVANSKLTEEHLVKHIGVPAARVRTIYLGTDEGWAVPTPDDRADARRWLRLEDGRPAIAFVGALGLDRRKGFDTLLNAWTRLCGTPGSDTDLVVAGGGAGAKTISLHAERAGLSSRIRVLGHTNRVQDVLAAVDLLVSPVRYEPYGLNVQEALCRGVPAIVSRKAGVAERYPHELSDMLLNDPDSSEELLNVLRRWRREPDAWKVRVAPLGRALRAYGWRDMASALVDTAGVAADACPDGAGMIASGSRA